MSRRGRLRISFDRQGYGGRADERVPGRDRARRRELGAYCPDLPGVGVVGGSREEVEELIREAISFHLDGLRRAGDPIPEPSAVAATRVEVPAA
jgi:predicted RNase H-like HicB family nuclease